MQSSLGWAYISLWGGLCYFYGRYFTNSPVAADVGEDSLLHNDHGSRTGCEASGLLALCLGRLESHVVALVWVKFGLGLSLVLGVSGCIACGCWDRVCCFRRNCEKGRPQEEREKRPISPGAWSGEVAEVEREATGDIVARGVSRPGVRRSVQGEEKRRFLEESTDSSLSVYIPRRRKPCDFD